MSEEWIGVDLDGTLANDIWPGGVYNPRFIGEPVPAMLEMVKNWIAAGEEVRIFTARVSSDRFGVTPIESIEMIKAWCRKHIGAELEVTCVKSFRCKAIYDDRAFRVVRNTGEIRS